MPSESHKLANVFVRQTKSYEVTRSQIERLYRQKKVSRKLVEQTYMGLFLSSYTAFETFLETLFIGLLVEGRGYKQRGVVPRISVRTHMLARELIVGNKNYVEWLPYNHTLDRANLFFRGGRPFADLESRYLTLLTQTGNIRNALAHKSDFSQEKFLKNVVNTQTLSPREKMPIGYLMALHAAPHQTKFEYHMDILAFIARLLTTL